MSNHDEQVSESAAELLCAARWGSKSALETLFTLYGKEISLYAFQLLGSREDSEDLMQDAFVRVVRGIHDFRGDSSFRTWLYKIVNNLVADTLRKRPLVDPLSVDNLTQDARDRLLGSADNDQSLLDLLPYRVEVERALGHLEPKYRAAVLLVDREGFSFREAADVLGVSHTTVARRCDIARTILRNTVMPVLEEPSR